MTVLDKLHEAARDYGCEEEWSTILEVIEAAEDVDDNMGSVDPEEEPEFAKAITRLEFALMDLEEAKEEKPCKQERVGV